jgi:hypothetical protein
MLKLGIEARMKAWTLREESEQAEGRRRGATPSQEHGLPTRRPRMSPGVKCCGC